jgi:hypothetical protein
MGGPPLVISIFSAEAKAWGDVGRALTAPIIRVELLGGAVLPAIAFAAAGRSGPPAVLGTAYVLLLLVVASSFAPRPPTHTSLYDKGA